MDSLHWPTAKPYQPKGITFQPYTIGSTGVIKLDGDRDSKYSSARDYAEEIVKTNPSLKSMIHALREYDVAVASQTAELLDNGGLSLTDDELTACLTNAMPQVRLGFALYKRSKLSTAQ